jgi:hypothetical protein
VAITKIEVRTIQKNLDRKNEGRDPAAAIAFEEAGMVGRSIGSAGQRPS